MTWSDIRIDSIVILLTYSFKSTRQTVETLYYIQSADAGPDL